MIKFKDVSKVYPDGTEAVKDLTLTIAAGELVVFIGTSGSGKTTSMRMINRMETPSAGQIMINGEDIRDKNPVDLRRRIGYVIQSTGLMPHMTVYENITMVPNLLNWEEDRMRAKAEELMEKVDMDPELYFDRYPSELSGGQQQRIGVIRALAADQEIILMDEPFGALDPITRESLQEVVMNLQKNMGRTVIFVTHDMDEALQIADKIAILSKGELIQFDTPENIIANPVNDFVREFIGEERLQNALGDMSVEAIMNPELNLIASDMNVAQATELLESQQVDSLYIQDTSDKLLGYVTLDVLRESDKETSITDVMAVPSIYAKLNAHIKEPAELILTQDIRELPVLDEKGHIHGVLTREAVIEVMSASTWGIDGDSLAHESGLGSFESEVVS
jgi:osmoprotectant transport system ATP-binding protein